MNKKRLKIERLLPIVVALALCAFFAVRVTFAWFATNTSKMAIVTGDADLDVVFYRLRDFNRDGVYDYNDYLNDLKDPVWSARDDFKEFTDKLAATLAAAGETETAITAENFERAFAALSVREDVTAYTYTTDFTSLVDGVNMGSCVVYRVRIANNSARAASAALSFGNLMRYYYSTAQMEYYRTNHRVVTAIEGDDGYNIENYASKFLFSVEYGEGETTVNTPLWNVAQSESVTAVTVGAATTEGAGSADLDFRLIFDGKSAAEQYFDYVTKADGECYRECLNISQSIIGAAGAAQFTAEYLRAVYEAEMTYLFSSSSGSGGGNVQPNVNLKLDTVQITGALLGQAVNE